MYIYFTTVVNQFRVKSWLPIALGYHPVILNESKFVFVNK